MNTQSQFIFPSLRTFRCLCERHKISSSCVFHEIFPFLELYRINLFLLAIHFLRRCRCLSSGRKSLKYRWSMRGRGGRIICNPQTLLLYKFCLTSLNLQKPISPTKFTPIRFIICFTIQNFWSAWRENLYARDACRSCNLIRVFRKHSSCRV